ncbi:MAG: hypothetical protein M3O30_03785 [Planctomycetota bacterium]|nr:hypothetical protein [Planctomycetota bacterium]
MKCRWLFCLAFIGSLCLGREFARADADLVPSSWKEDVEPSGHKDDIVNKMGAAANNLNTSATTASARKWFEDAASVNGDATLASPAYRQLYGEALNKQFLSLLTNPKTAVRVRVNIAIISSVVSVKLKTNALLPTVLQLLNDKSDAVVLAAEKPAGNLLPSLFNQAKGDDRDNLLAAMVKSVADHSTPPMAGDIAQDAYKGMNPLIGNFQVTGSDFDSIAKYNLDMQKARLELYKTGSSGIPDSPVVDTYPSEFLLAASEWGQLQDPDKLRAIQQAVDLISMAAQRAEKRSANQNDELIKTIDDEGYPLLQLAKETFKDAACETAIQAVRQISVGSRPEAIETARAALFPALHDAAANAPILANLVAPPDLNGDAGTTPAPAAAAP